MTAPKTRRATMLRVEPKTDTARDTGAAIWRAALSAAADSAADELAAAPDGGWPAAELRVGASLLCAAAELRLHDPQGTMPRIAFPPVLPAKRMLAGMRRALLAQVRAGALESTAAVEVLDALESIAAELDEDAGHRFASRLGGMGGLELIVDVAHDMRSPLGSILFLAEQIRRGHSGARDAGAGATARPDLRRGAGAQHDGQRRDGPGAWR